MESSQQVRIRIKCPWPGMGMTVAQLQDSSGGDRGKRLNSKATLKGRSVDSKASSSSFFTRALLTELTLTAGS